MKVALHPDLGSVAADLETTWALTAAIELVLSAVFTSMQGDVGAHLKDRWARDVMPLWSGEPLIKSTLLGVHKSLCILAVDLHMKQAH